MQFYQVKFRAVAFVLAETIFRETRAEVAHNRVARDFCDHARRGDAEAVAIAVDDRSLGEREGEHRKAVDEDVLGLPGQRGDRGPHRLVGRAQDVDRVDLERIDDADGPANRLVCHEIAVNFLALLRQELLRVVQLSMPKSFRQNNGGCYDGSRERAAASFVDSRDSRDTERAKFAFMPETTATVHEGKILKR